MAVKVDQLKAVTSDPLVCAVCHVTIMLFKLLNIKEVTVCKQKRDVDIA